MARGPAALVHDISSAEFVRETILAFVRNPANAISGSVARSLRPLIGRMFRYSWFLATEKRDAMVHEGHEEEVNAGVAEATPAEPERRSGERRGRPSPDRLPVNPAHCGAWRSRRERMARAMRQGGSRMARAMRR